MKNVLLIDAHALIHRAFHALPPLSGPEGQPTGALYGLARILMKVFREEQFTRIFAAFDRPEPTHRKDTFAEYKAHRPKAPDELVSQLIEARELFRVFGVPVVEVPKVEADDIIGTLAIHYAREKYRVTILTGDLDALQLVRDPYIKVKTFKKGVSDTFTYDEAAVRDRYGFGPEYVPDLKGIMGDASDNIKGVPGVGEGSALKLVRTYGSIENIYAALKRDGTEETAKRAGIQARFAKLMILHENEARFSKKLATIDTAVPLEAPNKDFEGVSEERIVPYFARMGFESLVAQVATRTPERETKELSLPDERGFPSSALFVKDPDHARKLLSRLAKPGEKIAYHWKELLKTLEEDAVKVHGPLFDISVAGWIVDPDETDFSREALTERFLPKRSLLSNPDDAALYRILKEKMLSYGLTRVFEEVEMPLIPALAAMERTGIAVSKPRLSALSRTMKKELKELEARIYEQAGGPFNLNSPRQVANTLFERLELGTEKKRRTSTGQRRTGRDVLMELKDTHPVVPLILEYRETFKIFSSFVEPLIAAIGNDGRVHTTFLQTGTATGRLSSADPNLQNIPQGSKWAKTLRSAFVASKGSHFVSFDYSQLELRLLAHASGDEALSKAFREGKDIHTLTAARVFNVPPSAVEPRMRRTAKTLNFGIVYGMGARAFSASSGLSLTEAKRFMDEYFRQFPTVRVWQERVKEEAKANGYVTNENGRRRWFRAAAARGHLGEVERAAVNMPLQSLGADIIKMAMREAHALLSEHANAHMVLSVHDELLFELPHAMLNAQVPVIRARMESVMSLSVPLRVEVNVGPDWGSMGPWQSES